MQGMLEHMLAPSICLICTILSASLSIPQDPVSIQQVAARASQSAARHCCQFTDTITSLHLPSGSTAACHVMQMCYSTDGKHAAACAFQSHRSMHLDKAKMLICVSRMYRPPCLMTQLECLMAYKCLLLSPMSWYAHE